MFKVNYAITGYEEAEVYIANTKGLEQGFATNGAYSYVSALVRQDGQVKSGSKLLFDKDWSKFDAGKLAQEAVQEAVSLLGASSVSGGYRILLRRDVARSGSAPLFRFSAEAVQKGLSLLQGRLESSSPAPPHFSGRSSWKMQRHCAFRWEGVVGRCKNVIERVLTTYLHNLKTARKWRESTGNAAHPLSPVGIAPPTFH